MAGGDDAGPARPTGWAAASGAAAHVVVDGALDARIDVVGAAGHHLSRVRRLRVGEAVTAADGRGGWRLYEVAAARGSEVSLDARGEPCREPRLAPGLTVAFGLSKAAKPDVVVRGLTELGVDRIVPLVTRRSVPRWDGRRTASALDRLGRIAREAAEQSRRSRLPEIGDAVGLTSLAGREGLVVATRADPSDGDPGTVSVPPGSGWTLVVGPEGGLDPDEIRALDRGGGVERLTVGPFVLRAETAALAAAAALTARRTAGDPGCGRA